MAEDISEKGKSLEEQRRESVKKTPGINPEQARERLIGLGYQPHMWKIFEEQDLGSHFVRALIHIAQGSESRILDDVYQELYPEHPLPGNQLNPKPQIPERKEKINPLPKPQK